MKREMLTKTTFTGTGRDAFSAAAVCAGASPAAEIFTPPPPQVNHSRFARPVALLAALFFAASLQADTVYRQVWVQDFEDAETYKAQLNGNSYINAKFGISAASTSATPGGTISQGDITPYNAAKSEKYLRLYTKSNTELNTTFAMPEVATSAADYKVEFDYFHSAPTTDKMAGLAIQGSSGVLATFYTANGTGNDKETTGYIYKGDDVEAQLAEFKTWARGTDPASSSALKYWLHVTVVGNSSGVFLSVENAGGTKYLTSEKISDTFDTVAAIFIRWTSGQRWDRYMSLDNVAVSLPATATTYTWTGNAKDGKWDTLSNWSVDGATPTSVPTSVDSVTIPDNAGIIIVPANTEFGTMTIGSGVSFAVLTHGITSETSVLTLPTLADGTTLSADLVAVYGPYATTVADGEIKITRVPSVFTWTVSSGAWNNIENWLVGGNATQDAPGANDTVVFPNETTATIAANPSVSNITAKANVTIDGGDTFKYYVAGLHEIESVRASEDAAKPRIILKNAGLQSADVNTYTVKWNADIEISGTCELRTYTTNTSNQKSLYYYGDLHGDGTLTCHPPHNKNSTRVGIVMYGDNSDFSGSITMKSGNTGASGASSRTPGFLGAASASSAKAAWTISGNNNYKDTLTDLRSLVGSSTATNKLYFGALNGTWYAKVSDPGKNDTNPYYNMYIEFVIGGADADSVFEPIFSRAGGNDRSDSYIFIRKVGDRKLSIVGKDTGTSVRAYFLDGGEMEFQYNNCLTGEKISFGGGTLSFANSFTNNLASAEDEPDESIKDISAYIKDSTGAISVSLAEGQVSTWATALAASNMGGFTKKGAGTLTLEKTPKYTGATRIEAGALVVKEAFDTSSTTIVVDDLAAAAEAGTVYLAATSLTGTRPTLESSGENASQYKFVKTTTTIDGAEYEGYSLEKRGGLLIIVR